MQGKVDINLLLRRLIVEVSSGSSSSSSRSGSYCSGLDLSRFHWCDLPHEQCIIVVVSSFTLLLPGFSRSCLCLYYLDFLLYFFQDVSCNVHL